MQSHYEINVSWNGRHLFATAERSCVSKSEFDIVLPIIKRKFPKEEGYEVNATYWEISGSVIKK